MSESREALGPSTVAGEIPIGLSTASVYPQNTEAAFAYAADLGFDGVELMVWGDPVSQDIRHVEHLSERYQVPVLSIHAPCLLITQRVWGRDPLKKLARAAHAAEALGAATVVVHPPFRWQRAYVEGFDDLVGELSESDVSIAVENMFPMRADRVFGAGERSARRLTRRGGTPGPAVSAFGKSIDPTDDGLRPLHPRPLAHRDRGHRRSRPVRADGHPSDAPASRRRIRGGHRRALDPRRRDPAVCAGVSPDRPQ